MTPYSPWRLAALWFLALMIAGGCEQAFEPLQESDRYFSIYGYLDPAADTQWVRVMPVRGSIGTSPAPIDAIVTLEHLGTGRKIVLSDALFSYRSINLGGEDLFAYNFFTTERLEHEATYRLTATRSDGASSTAVVPVPAVFPTVVVGTLRQAPRPPPPSFPPRPVYNRDYVRIEGVDHLAMVNLVHHIWVENHPFWIVPIYLRPERATSPADGVLMLELDRRDRPLETKHLCMALEMRRIPVPPPEGTWYLAEQRCNIDIVAAAAPWPFSPLFTSGTIAHIDVATNVTNGVGFVGGIARRAIPYERCELIGPHGTGDEFCELTYNDRTAVIQGRVTDEWGVPLASAEVVLHDLIGAKLRPTRTDLNGSYRIDGLDPGVVYGFCAVGGFRVGDREPPRFFRQEATHVFDPGQGLTVDVVLTQEYREGGC